MTDKNWIDYLPAAIVLTDKAGNVTYMNDAADADFAADGGRNSIVGKNLFECHSEQSNRIIQDIISSKQPNIYTIEKKGVKKLIYQAPLYCDGEYTGLAELSIVLPVGLKNQVRE